MQKPLCSVCLKEVNIDEFLEWGGYCKECSTEIDKIMKKEGLDGVTGFWKRKREEAAKKPQ